MEAQADLVTSGESRFWINTEFGNFMGSLVVVTAFFEVRGGRFE